jgi:hypothetical protein
MAWPELGCDPVEVVADQAWEVPSLVLLGVVQPGF